MRARRSHRTSAGWGTSSANWVPYACAAANLAAALALATVLAPGTPLGADPDAYVRSHLLAWRVGWTLWILAAVTLVLFYAWWARRVGRARVAVWIAMVGLIGDVACEALLIAWDPATAPLAYLLTGVWANGLYTVAGVLLTLATPLARALRAGAWWMWGWGAGIALGGLAGVPLLTAISTAALFAVLPVWVVAFARSEA